MKKDKIVYIKRQIRANFVIKLTDCYRSFDGGNRLLHINIQKEPIRGRVKRGWGNSPLTWNIINR